MADIIENLVSPFPHLLNSSITAGFTVLVILAARLVLRKAPRRFYCALWSIAGLRLLIPFKIESSLSLIPAAAPIPYEILTAQGSALHQPAEIEILSNPAFGAPLAGRLEITNDIFQTRTLLFNLIWLAVLAAMLLYALISWIVLKNRLRTATRLADGIFESDRVKTPFLLGILRPVIYLPYGMPQDALGAVISHEKAHIARLDHIWKPLGFVLLSCHWFNPLIWLAYALFCRDIEAACDEKVIADMDENGRKVYSSALLACSAGKSVIPVCPLAFGELSVKTRVRGVMDYRRPAAWLSAFAVMLCAVMAACLLTDPAEGWIYSDQAVLEYVQSHYALDDHKIAYGEFLSAGSGPQGGFKKYSVVLDDGSTDTIQVNIKWKRGLRTVGPGCKVLGIERCEAPFDGESFASDELNRAIERAVLENLTLSGPESCVVRTESHRILDISAEHSSDRNIKVYIWTLCEDFDADELAGAIQSAPGADGSKPAAENALVVSSDALSGLRGAGCSLPAAISFEQIRLESGEISYILAGFEIPRDGSYYADDIKKLFSPAALQGIYRQQEYIAELEAENKAEALALLAAGAYGEESAE